MQVWQPAESAKECTPGAKSGGVLYNSMIAPYAVGPMALKAATWYQGESNVGQARFYACAFLSMIKWWRIKLANPSLWFGFVQIAGYRYSHPYGPEHKPEVDHSHAAADLRQAQLAALALAHVGMSTAVDTGDWTNIHPPDKQWPSRRLARQALSQLYGHQLVGTDFPMFAGSELVVAADGALEVTVAVRARGEPTSLTTDAPIAATQSSTLGVGADVTRTECITANPGYGLTFPEDCGYPQIIGINSSGAILSLNASARIGADGSSIMLVVYSPPPGFTAQATSYGRASWPRTVFFSASGDRLPVLPWFATLNQTSAFSLPDALVPVDSAAIVNDVSQRIAVEAKSEK